MSVEPNFNAQDYELLSAYLDGELSNIERLALEGRLASEPELQQELASLRGMVALVEQLPRLKAPRNFSLTPAMVGQVKAQVPVNIYALPRAPRRFQPAWASLAAAVLVMLFGVSFILSEFNASNGQLATSAGEPAFAPAVDMTAEEVALAPTNLPTLDSDAIVMQSQATGASSGAEMAEQTLAFSAPADGTVLEDSVANTQSDASRDLSDAESDELLQESQPASLMMESVLSDTTSEEAELYNAGGAGTDDTALLSDADTPENETQLGFSIATEDNAQDSTEGRTRSTDAPIPSANANNEAQAEIVQKASPTDTATFEPSATVTPTMIPTLVPLPAEAKQPAGIALDNTGIGILLLVFGAMLFLVSIIVIRRARR